MANPLTFANIKSEIESVAKQFLGAKTTQIGYLANLVYMTEIMAADPMHPLFWMLSLNTTRFTIAPQAITAISKANPGVITCAGHGYVTGDVVSLWSILGMTELNGVLGTVTKIGADTFSIGVDTTNFTTYTSGGYIYHRGVTLASDVGHLLTAGWNQYDENMRPYTPEKWEQYVDNHNVNYTGKPERYLFTKSISGGAETNQIIWAPGADNVYRLRYWYHKHVDRLSADGDYPNMPAQFHDAIISGVVARLEGASKSSQEPGGMQSLWPTIYSANLEAIVTYNRKHWSNIDAQTPVKPYML